MRTGPGIGNADNAPGNDGQKKPEKALMLEDLRLRFETNVYFAAPGRGWFEWGVPWGRHRSYASLSDFQADLAIDSGGCVTDPGFLDILARDYRISRAAMDPLAEVYPQRELKGHPAACGGPAPLSGAGHPPDGTKTRRDRAAP
jgi:hypothetical protein